MIRIKKEVVQPKGKPGSVASMAKAARKSTRPADGLPFVVSAETPIPRSYAGKYIAMLPDGRTIVAVGKTLGVTRLAAAKVGHTRVGVMRVPLARSIG